VLVNLDDDNENGIPDGTEAGPILGEDDLEPFLIKWAPANRPEEPINNYFGWNVTLIVHGPAALWTTADKSGPITLQQFPPGWGVNWVVGVDPIPSTLYLEALSSTTPGGIQLHLLLTSPQWGATDGDTVVFTALDVERPKVDVDGDNNNDGAIAEDDDPIEEEHPGYFLHYNRDDDNRNGSADYLDGPTFVDDQGQPMEDDELKPVRFTLLNPEAALPGYRVTFGVGGGTIKLWKTRDKQPFPLTYVIGTDVLPAEFFVEGVKPGPAAIAAGISNEAGAVLHRDLIRLFVGYVDLIAHRPQTEGPGYGNPFPKAEVPFPYEEDPGAGIRMNGDDDDGDGTADRSDVNGVTGENDLLEVDVDTQPKNVPNVGWVLRRSGSEINVFLNSDRTQPVWGAGGDQNVIDVTNLIKSGTAEFWVEWASTSVRTSATLTLEMRDVRVPAAPKTLTWDKIRFDPFASIVIVFGGNNTNPLAATDGAFQIAERLYRGETVLHAGYDVHAYNEEDLDTAADTRFQDNILQEVVSAVQNRGVEQVVILGYSQGGGATFQLADILAAYKAANQGFVYSLDFTAYIDAIMHGKLNLGFAEDNRPPSSAYHVHYRQASGNRYTWPCTVSSLPFPFSLLLEGVDTPPGPTVNINVTATTWGAALHHCNIDNSPMIIDRLINGMILPNNGLPPPLGPGDALHYGIVDLIIP
jgi:hypothetical protein